MLYTGPFKEHTNYEAKFVRVENEVYTTAPGEVDLPHKIFASLHGLRERIELLRRTNPAEIDAGLHELKEGMVIYVHSDSTGLHLPVFDYEVIARQRTVEVMRSLDQTYPVCSTVTELRRIINSRL